VLFTGESEHTIDGKLRLAVPAKYRHQWDAQRDGGAWFCLPWPPDHLRLYTEAEFTRMSLEFQASLTPSTQLAELQSTLFSNAERLELDSAGRLSLPKRHVERVKLPVDVFVVGAGRRLEIYSKARWTQIADERWQKLQTTADNLDVQRSVGPLMSMTPLPGLSPPPGVGRG
jgi:MraZ protein